MPCSRAKRIRSQTTRKYPARPIWRITLELQVEAIPDLRGQRISVALRGPGERELAQVRLERPSIRRLEARQVVALLERGGVAVDELELHRLRDRERVVTGFGELREECPHLLRRLQVELLGVEPEPFRVGLQLLLLDAEQHVVRLGVGGRRVVQVVGRDEADAELPREGHLPRRHAALLREAVVLELDPVVAGAEDVPVLARPRPVLEPPVR